MSVQIITANRLVDGAVVYFTAARTWSEAFADSAVFREADAAKAGLESVTPFVTNQVVVGPYLAEVDETEDGIEPNSARERIRASRGPSVAADAGSWVRRIGG
jgi:hypothetical protein